MSIFVGDMKIFTSAQIQELDKYTIEHEPIKSIDLMERVARILTRTITGFVLVERAITNLKEIKDDSRHVVMCHYPITFFRAGFAPSAFMLYGHVHQTKEYEYLKELRKVIKANASGYGTPNGNFINVGAMMPYMNYTPRTLDEIIAGDEAYRQTDAYLQNRINETPSKHEED